VSKSATALKTPLLFLFCLACASYAFSAANDLPPLSEDKLKDVPLSGVAYFESLRAIGRLPKPFKPVPAPPFRRQPLDPSVLYNVNATSDANQDVETAIGSFNYGTQATAVIGSIKYVNIGGVTVPRDYFATTTDFSTFTRGQLPMPNGYNESGDPYVSSYGSTAYVSGIVFNGASTTTPNGIALWKSSNGGTCWPNCQASDAPVALIPNSDTNWYMDKPAIAVNQSTNFLAGHVYVAYTKANNGNPAMTQIRLARYTSGTTFDADILLVTLRGTGAQVVVPPDGTGTIYVVYVNYQGVNTNRQLRMATVHDYADGRFTFDSDEAITGSRNLIIGGDAALTGGVQALTLPSAKWNRSLAESTWCGTSANLATRMLIQTST
jgi:hypothetical protein